jgi:hypothetical protein
MAPISAALRLPQTVVQLGIARVYSHKIALRHVPLIFASHIFCPVGRDPQLTQRFSLMPIRLTFTSQMGGIILQMLASPCQMCCLSPIKVCGTICWNGVEVMKHKLSIFTQAFSSDAPLSPCNPKEIFNLRHASARNVIEQIFGILKQHFRILQLPPQYDMSIQSLIPPTLAAIHNFIRQYDPGDIHVYDYLNNPNDDNNEEPLDPLMGVHPESVGELGVGVVMPQERAAANERQDKIAADMWAQYQDYLQTACE